MDLNVEFFFFIFIKQLNRYVLTEKIISQAGFAKVKLAIHKRAKEEVVIKIYENHSEMDDQKKRSIVYEVQYNIILSIIHSDKNK